MKWMTLAGFDPARNDRATVIRRLRKLALDAHANKNKTRQRLAEALAADPTTTVKISLHRSNLTVQEVKQALDDAKRWFDAHPDISPPRAPSPPHRTDSPRRPRANSPNAAAHMAAAAAAARTARQPPRRKAPPPPPKKQELPAWLQPRSSIDLRRTRGAGMKPVRRSGNQVRRTRSGLRPRATEMPYDRTYARPYDGPTNMNWEPY